jgi:hypothetical protein
MLGSRENGKTRKIDSKPPHLRFLFGNMARDDRMCNSATVPQGGSLKRNPDSEIDAGTVTLNQREGNASANAHAHPIEGQHLSGYFGPD